MRTAKLLCDDYVEVRDDECGIIHFMRFTIRAEAIDWVEAYNNRTPVSMEEVLKKGFAEIRKEMGL